MKHGATSIVVRQAEKHISNKLALECSSLWKTARYIAIQKSLISGNHQSITLVGSCFLRLSVSCALLESDCRGFHLGKKHIGAPEVPLGAPAGTAERRSRLELSDHRRLDPGDRDRQRSPPIGRSVRPVHYRNARLVPVRGGSFTLGSFFKLNLSKK